MKGPKIKAENSLEFFHKNLAEQGLQENIFSNIPASSEFFTEKPFNQNLLKHENQLHRPLENKISSSMKNIVKEKSPFRKGIFFEINKIKWIKKAVTKFRQNSAFRKADHLKKIHFQIIGDVINNEKQMQSNKSREKLNKKDLSPKQSFKNSFSDIKVFLKKLPIINPNNQFKLFWDLFILLMIFINMFSISIQVTFDIEFDETTSQIILKGLSIITFFLDFFIKLKTSFYKHGSLIKSHKTIRDHYIKESFLIDFLSFCALVFNFFIYANSSIRWISLIFFAHVKTIKKIMINFENIIDFGDFYDLFVVMFKLLFIAHLYACMWHYIGYSQGEKTDHTWLKLMNIENSKWYIRYIYSIYWALTTMVTVGYGDIIPQNTYEVFFVSCAISSGSMVFGYCLNRIGSTLTKIDERDQELKQNIRIIDNYMKANNINADLKARTLNYLEFTWKLEQKNLDKEQTLMDQLPETLKKEILFETNGKCLSQFPILKNNFTQQILDKLCFSLKTIQYSPKETIYLKGDIDDNEQNLFLIVEGEVDVYLKQDILKSITKFQTFGEKEFFLNIPYQETIISKTFTTLYKLNRKNFIDLLKNHPEQYENFCDIKDKVALNEDYSKLYSPCFSCNENHPIYKCPIVNYIPNKTLLFLRKTYSKPQKRENFRRKKKSNYTYGCTLRNFQKNKKTALTIRFDPCLMDIFLKSEKNKTNQAETDSFSLKKSESCFDINCKHHNTQKKTRSLEFIRDLNPSFESQAKMSKSLPNKNSLKKIHSFEEMNHESSIHKILFHSTKTNRKFKESNHNLQSLINDNRSSILAQNEHSSSDNNSSKIIIPQEEEKKNESSINSNLSHSSKERQKSEDSFTLEKNESNENLSFNKINAKRIETLKEMSEKNADDKNEKTKNLNMFLYDFEAIKNYSKYFQNGNCKNILTKLIKSKKIMMGKNFKRKSRINEL